MLVQCKLEYALIYITVIPIPCHPRLQVVPHLSSGIVERAKGERAGKSPHRVSPFSRLVIFTRARVSLAQVSLRKNGGLFVVY